MADRRSATPSPSATPPPARRSTRPTSRTAPTSFEERAPDAAEMAARIERYAATHAWLVAEREGEVVGFAYACPHRARPAYRWAADVSVYVAADRRGEGLGRAPLRGALRAPARAAASGSPAPASPCRTRPASPCTRASASSRSASTAGSAGRPAPGATSAGGSWSWRPGAEDRPPEPLLSPAASPATIGRCPTTRPQPPPRAPETLTEEDVYEALEEVIDPELGLDFVSLGLVYDVDIEKEDVYVTFTLTTPACPIGPQVSEQMKEFVGDLPGVTAVHPKMVFDPPWSPEMMTDDAKFALASRPHPSLHDGRRSSPSSRGTPQRVEGEGEHRVVADDHRDLDQRLLVVGLGQQRPRSRRRSSLPRAARRRRAAGRRPRPTSPSAAGPAATRSISSRAIQLLGEADVLAPLVVGAAVEAGAQDQELPVARRQLAAREQEAANRSQTLKRPSWRASVVKTLSSVRGRSGAGDPKASSSSRCPSLHSDSGTAVATAPGSRQPRSCGSSPSISSALPSKS